MTAVQRFKDALELLQIDETTVAEIMNGYEKLTDKLPKEKRAEFFCQAIVRMEAALPLETCQAIRDACACSKGGWRLKAMQKLAREHAADSLEAKLAALRLVTYMGNPVLNEDGTITAGIGAEGGFPCPCPVFEGQVLAEPPSITYCYCCAGHFRYHYQIALGKKLTTRAVLSSALESKATRPCRFVFEIEG